MLDGHRESIACPCKILRIKHQITVDKVNAALTKPTKLMALGAAGGIYTIAGLISNCELRLIAAGVATAIEGNIVFIGCGFIHQLQNQIRASCFVLSSFIHQLGHIKSIDFVCSGLNADIINKISMIKRHAIACIDLFIYTIQA